MQIKKKYLLAEETIDEKDRMDLIAWLETDPWLTQGKLVREFESRWAAWLGVPYAVFVNSGSSANLLMVYAALLSKRFQTKKVIVPAVSWATSIAPVIQLGLEPVLCEADPQTFGLDLNHLEDLIKKHKPSAVMAVHVLGVPNAMQKLLDLQHRYDFMLLEDSCAATGSRDLGKYVGTFGAMSTFSFFYGHHLSTIEGGMICTQDEALCDILLQIRSHGWAKDLSREKQIQKAQQAGVSPFNQPFTFYYPGFNVRSTDLNARLGLSQMDKLETVLKRRIENHKIYQNYFAGDSRFQFQTHPGAEICSIAFCALAPDASTRDQIAKVLKEEGIETRPLGGGNMSRQPFWKARYPEIHLPVADRIEQTCFQLPNHPRLLPEDIHFICGTALSVFSRLKT